MGNMGAKSLIAQNVKKYRIHNHLSQKELAVNVGVSQGLISSIEHGDKFPSAELIDRICDNFKIETHKLFTEGKTPFLDATHIIETHFRSRMNREIDKIVEMYREVL